MKRLLLLATSLVIGLGPVAGASSWPARSPRPLPAPHAPVGPIYSIARNLYVVPGGGGNTAVFVTSTGVVLVDTKYEDRYQAMLDQVRTVTDKPITHVINTHRHADHRGGNARLDPNVEIISMQEPLATSLAQRPGLRSSFGSQHIRSCGDMLTLFSGADQIDVHYFGPAHTSGDLFVVFRDAGVMHAGDVFSGKGFPIINIDGAATASRFRRCSIAWPRSPRSSTSSPVMAPTWQDLLDFRDLTPSSSSTCERG